MANQFALVLPVCARYTIAAAADAPAVRRASIAVSKKINTTRLACARLLTMWKMDNASERTRKALTTEFATTKNLQF